MSGGKIAVEPIGTVRSPVADPRAMPTEGVEAEIEVFSPFVGGLREIEENSHLIVLVWLDRAGPGSATIGPPERSRGVFGLRSVARPNPLGLSVCRLLGVSDGLIRVANLDFVHGSPVIDLKRYSPSWDCVFSALSGRDRGPAAVSAEQLDEAIREAAAFHGEICPALITGCRLVLQVAAAWNLPRKAPALQVQVTGDGCLADTLQALTGATFGAERLSWSAGSAAALRGRDRGCRLDRRTWPSPSIEAARTLPLEALFAFLDTPPW